MPALNVHFTDEEHQILKVTAATMGATQQQLVRLSVEFTRCVVYEYLKNPDGTAFEITELLTVMRDDEACYGAWVGMDAHLAYVRSLERVVADEAANGNDHSVIARKVLASKPMFRNSLDEKVTPRRS